jgi:hypothetical protein
VPLQQTAHERRIIAAQDEYFFISRKFHLNTQTNVWYCDPYGRNAQPEPFPGSVPVYISDDSGFKVDGYTNFNRDFVNSGPGVKAPN